MKTKAVNKSHPKNTLTVVSGRKNRGRNTGSKKTGSAVPGRANLAGINEFEQLKALSGFSAEALAPLLGTTTRTLQNKKSSKMHFNLSLTERLRKLIQLFQQGAELFGSSHEFSHWLYQPAYGLDHAIPIDLIKNPGGLEQVLDELSAIKYGDTI